MLNAGFYGKRACGTPRTQICGILTRPDLYIWIGAARSNHHGCDAMLATENVDSRNSDTRCVPLIRRVRRCDGQCDQGPLIQQYTLRGHHSNATRGEWHLHSQIPDALHHSRQLHRSSLPVCSLQGQHLWNLSIERS